MKATHQGHCQVCGALQKLPNGKLSKHGYTVDWGFFNGVCAGAGHLPFEQDISLVEGALSRALLAREDVESTQAELRKAVPPGTTKAWVREYFPNTKVGDGYRWVEVECYEVRHDRDGHKWSSYHHAYIEDSGAHAKSEQHRPIAQYERAESLEAAITIQNRMYAAFLDKTIASIVRYVAWQRQRIMGWEPHPDKLIPITE